MKQIKPISKWNYGFSMVGLVAVKTAVEIVVGYWGLGVQLPIWTVFAPVTAWNAVLKSYEPLSAVLRGYETFAPFYIVWSLAFIAAGFWLTLRRAHTLSLKLSTALLFFVPGLNLIQMIYMMTAPPVPGRVPEAEGVWSIRLVTALQSLGVTVVLGVLYTAVSVYVFHSYGMVLFFASPFVYGIVNGYLANRKIRIGRGATQVSAALGIALVGGAMLLLAMEGVMCIAMAAPLAFAMSAIGALVGEQIAKSYHPSVARLPVFIVAVLLPFSGAVESSQDDRAAEREVLSVIEINAPPEAVWKYVVEVPIMPQPEEFSFRVGIAYPLRAYVHEWKLGGTRVCEFNTGVAMETMTAFEEGRLLRFHINSQPAQMEELSPYRDVHAPHLHGFVESEDGEFKLIALPGGRTRLEGRSWYRNHIEPGKYWSLFTDHFVHQIHMRVMAQIKRSAENAYAQSLATTRSSVASRDR